MFVLDNSKNLQYKIPIKVWLPDSTHIEGECLQQAIHLSNFPFAHSHVALMPDTHSGYGMPIGGVLATKEVIIPNAVGVDIGCGVAFAESDIHKSEVSKKQLQHLVEEILKAIPTGFSHHSKRQRCRVLDEFKKNIDRSKIPHELYKEIDEGYYQVGTLGGGNHFIELQEDEKGMLCVMIHSGSRNFGYKIAHFFNHLAKTLKDKWNSVVPPSYDLAYLPVGTVEGKQYIDWMNLALQFANENRERMLMVVKEKMQRRLSTCIFSNEINAHHNYASYEKHFGEYVWVHRKGAISARRAEKGIIPGSMGSYSYIVEGLGNEDSFKSCSHGAGRQMSRKAAKKHFSIEEVVGDLNQQNVILGKRKLGDVAEESRFAYKDIEFVIQQQLDLIKPIKKLKTIAVVKG